MATDRCGVTTDGIWCGKPATLHFRETHFVGEPAFLAMCDDCFSESPERWLTLWTIMGEHPPSLVQQIDVPQFFPSIAALLSALEDL